MFDFFFKLFHLVNQQQVRALAKRFPPEEHDTFYSHTQRAFSKGNHSEIDSKNYVFSCKKIEKNRLEVSKQKTKIHLEIFTIIYDF